jgi:hypothetical protein
MNSPPVSNVGFTPICAYPCCSRCEVSTGCPFDLSARSWLCDQTAFPERSNGLSPECPTDGSQSRAVSEKSS